MTMRLRQLTSLFVLFSCLLPISMADDQKDSQKTTADEKVAEAVAKPLSDYELMTLFVDAFQQIETNYVRDIDRRKLVEAAIEGMVSELDQYSSFVPPKARARFDRMLTQEFGGIGIQVNTRNGDLLVVSPVPGTPAYKAGILPGDIITRIGETETKGLSINQAMSEMQGPIGQTVKLRVLRAGQKAPISVSLTRELITVKTIRGYEYNDDDTWNYWVSEEPKIAYVRLSSFSRRSAEELEDVLRTLVSLEMDGLVLDLRFNPGGLLDGAIEMADLFLKSGKIVSVRGRNVPEKSWDARSRNTLPDFPFAVLVNGYSASASEVLSACLQDNERAVVVGERTWGKGSVQNVIRIDEGRSILKLTTASYHRPSGVNIHRFKEMGPDDTWGVLPDEDFEIPYSRKQWTAWSADRSRRDVVKRRDSIESFKEAAEEASKTDSQEAAKSGGKIDSQAAKIALSTKPLKESSAMPTTESEESEEAATPEPFDDTQLTAALDYIKRQLSESPISSD